MKNKSELDLLQEISKKLDVLTTAVACQGKSDEDKTRIFSASKLKHSELSLITGISAEAIQKRIERARRRVKK